MSKNIIAFCFVILLCSCSMKKNDIVQTPTQLSPNQNIPFIQDITIRDDAKVVDKKTCSLTPEVMHSVKIPKIYKTNNLRRRTGYATYAMGQFIRINGIVTDSDCVPILNATVQIWHADANGVYKNSHIEGYLNDSMMYSKQQNRFEQENNSQGDVNFTGSGSTTTDNLGRFSFLSIMPGKSFFINLRVLHKDFDELNTVVYLNKKSNVKAELIAHKENEINVDGVNELIYSHTLVLNGRNKYLKY